MLTHSAETVCATESKAGLSAENRNRNRNRNRKSIVSGPKPHRLSNKASCVINASLSGPTVPDADVDSAASFLGYLYIVVQHTVRQMTPCVWRILYLRNSSSVPMNYDIMLINY